MLRIVIAFCLGVVMLLQASPASADSVLVSATSTFSPSNIPTIIGTGRSDFTPTEDTFTIKLATGQTCKLTSSLATGFSTGCNYRIGLEDGGPAFFAEDKSSCMSAEALRNACS